MAEYRKKPVIVEAVQYNGYSVSVEDLCVRILFSEYPDWLEKAFERDILRYFGGYTLAIKTLEGNMVVSKGGYIIKGINGELYSCKPDIFEKTYEKA